MSEGLVVADDVDGSVTEALVMAKVVDESVTEELVVAKRHVRDRGGKGLILMVNVGMINFLALDKPSY